MMNSALTHTDWHTEFRWLCQQRAHYPPNADVWHLRFHWANQRSALNAAMRQQTYRFDPVQVLTTAQGETLHLRSARDAVVAKRLARWLNQHLTLSTRCTHLSGHGGLKQTIAAVQQALPHHTYVLRTDIKQYYEHIDHGVLLSQLDAHINDPWVLNLLGQTIHRTVERGGTFRTITRGIGRGCPLSPLYGALYLDTVDRYFATQAEVYYVRYMDDLLVLAPSRWKIRQAMADLHRLLAPLKLALHPDKTFIGKIERGFDFLGYRHAPSLLAMAQPTIDRFRQRIDRLYEQHRLDSTSKHSQDNGRVGRYVTRWRRWARAGLGALGRELDLEFTTAHYAESG